MSVLDLGKVVSNRNKLPYAFSNRHSWIIYTVLRNITHTHWEELLRSVSNFIFRLIISKHCGCTPRGVRGVKRSEILWGIWKYSLPGRPSTHHWVKSKTIIEKHQKLIKIIINHLLANFLQPKNIFWLENWICYLFFNEFLCIY